MNPTSSSLLSDPILMNKRERIRLERVEGSRNRVAERGPEALVLWYDSRDLATTQQLIERIDHFSYTGIVLYPETLESVLPRISSRLRRVLHVESAAVWHHLIHHPLLDPKSAEAAVIASPSPEVLSLAAGHGLATCYRAYVDDGDSLHAAIASGGAHAYLMVSFRDPTNIPLELVIATLQGTDTVLIKEIADPENVDDAVVTLGVMEVGADGVAFSPASHATLDRFLAGLEKSQTEALPLEPATVIRSVPVGMGYRSCLDLATLFSADEGMLVGSTSQGGILCCAEVFFLPYMELRPFRVNAGAVHSYVYNRADRTDYMSELRAGSSVMIVDTQGKPRTAAVGRVKTEVRPLRLIEAEFAGGKRINVLMQDDWHVRVFGDDGKPRNITELKPGDKVLGHQARPGRHVGIRVDEHILEN
jgi:3-dehydroquinate synthase II/3-amino-4-hydroxybenzoic acid synthase